MLSADRDAAAPAVYLTSDAVIAATKETMEDTIAYIDEKYEGAAKYLHEVRPHTHT